MALDSRAGVPALLPARPIAPREDNRFSRMVEALPTALVLTGAGGRIEMVNRQVERLFGYDRSELLDQPVEVLIAGGFRGRHVDLSKNFLAEMSSLTEGESADLFARRKDGSEFPLAIDLNPMDLDGEAMVLAGMVDITLRRQHERETETRRRELERSNGELEEFAYVASHDLKAPLRAISHLVQWIGEDVRATASPETLDHLALLEGRVKRMQLLLDGLLDYSRVGRGTQAPAEDVDIGELVADITDMLAPVPGFSVTCEAPMRTIRTHRTPIRVVLENLIGNGLQHHDRDTGGVSVSMRTIGGMIEFRVRDDGPGIEPRFHDRIFLIFHTLASRDEVESSGIGLSIVKKKVQEHGGDIWVESAPPARGSTFVFTWKESAL